jgi:hypothetical protein
MTHDDSQINDAPETELDSFDLTEDTNTEEEILNDADDKEESTEETAEEPDFFEKEKGFLEDDNTNPYLTDEMTDFLNDRITDYSAIGKNAGKQNITAGKNLNKIRGISISIAKREDILAQSHGEILISETINYRTQRPER